MKHLLLASSLLLSSTVFAADWTPVFYYIDKNITDSQKTHDSQMMIDSIIKNTFSDRLYNKDGFWAKPRPKQPLSKMALSGKFTALKAPYRNDMLPAIGAYKKDAYGHISPTATYPLKNATLYGYPIESLIVTDWGCIMHHCDEGTGFDVVFKPMSDYQFKLLTQKVEIDDHPCDGKLANFHKKGNKVILSLVNGC